MEILQTQEFKKYLLAFIIGSCIFSTIITMSYTGNAYRTSGRPKDVPFEMIPISIAIMFGLFNMLNIYLQNVLKDQLKFQYSNYAVAASVGALMGLTFSFAGRFGIDLPTKIFKIKKNQWVVHVIAPILYALIFSIIVQPLNQYFGIAPR